MNKFYIHIIIVLILIAQDVFSQNNGKGHRVRISIPEVAMLDLESNGTKDIVLSPVVSNEAGAPIDFDNINDNSVWVNYSSIVGSASEQTRNVVVSLSDEVPPGVNLKVYASEYSGNGNGKFGSPTGELILTTTPTELISSIGSCYTGNGPNKGHQLTYSLELISDEDYRLLDFDKSNTLTVTYTLTDIN